ncbi:MAG: hypothetical protein RBT34_04510 [Anaerolineaceae bacterium]|jgi:hypothetical protein|nr:hypothetical protein [Anaerolineaceae bacterium]
MKNRNPGTMEWINLIGIVVALGTLAVDPWAITAPGAEGLKIVLAVFFVLEAVCILFSMRSEGRVWLRVQFFLSLMVLAALMGALFVYRVRGEGIMVMIVIALMTTESSLMMSFLMPREVQAISRSKALEQLGSSWQMVAQQAVNSNSPLSVLSIYTMRPITSDMFNLLEKELRSRDMLMLLEDGLLVLLWNTMPAVALRVGNKLRNFIMEEAHLESWAGVASFPLHGDRMKLVLDHAEEALHAARTVDGPSVVVYGHTTRADTLASLEKDWKSLLDIAKEGQQSVSVLAVTTSQPLRAGMADLVQQELRARDVIASVPHGFYVFLFKADEHVVARVADRVEEALSQWKDMQSWVGTASYPGDGEQIGELLRHAERTTQRLANG